MLNPFFIQCVFIWTFLPHPIASEVVYSYRIRCTRCVYLNDQLPVIYLFYSSLVFQSAAMEETVIWEQHTVTLHRVGVPDLEFPFFS